MRRIIEVLLAVALLALILGAAAHLGLMLSSRFVR